MKFSTAALGFAGAATAAVTSTVLLNNYLGQDIKGDLPDGVDPIVGARALSTEGIDGEGGGVSGTGHGGVAFKALFDVNKINRGAASRPLLLFDKGSCFSSFFPAAELSAPTQTTTLNQSVSSAGVIPADFSFAGSTQPVGCKMMKFSGAKDNAAFGYMTETTVRNDKYGLAMYAAVTNTKQKTMTDLEYWLLFMKKNEDKWIVNKSYYLSLGMGTTVTTGNNKSTQKQNDFYAKTPNGTEMRWSSPTSPSETFNKFFESSTDTSSLWDDTKDKYYVGLWIVGNENGNNQELFYNGSNEKWALKEWFSSSDKTKGNEPNRFLNSVNLTQKGKWQSIGDVCSDLQNKEVSSMTTGAIIECIKQKAFTSSVPSKGS